jgi:hypothetical protein
MIRGNGAAARLFGSLLCGASLVVAAGSLGPAQAAGGLPFWGKPFPYYYVGTRVSCEQLRPVETPTGVIYEKVWVCGPVLHARD